MAKDELKLKYVDADGKDTTPEKAAYVVNPTDATAESFVDGLRNASAANEEAGKPRTLEPGNPGGLTLDYSIDEPVAGAPGAISGADRERLVNGGTAGVNLNTDVRGDALFTPTAENTTAAETGDTTATTTAARRR